MCVRKGIYKKLMLIYSKVAICAHNFETLANARKVSYPIAS